MSDLMEAAAIVREREAIAGKWLALHASDATPRTRRIAPMGAWAFIRTTVAVTAASVLLLAIAVAARAA